jgi:hypothetical protein
MKHCRRCGDLIPDDAHFCYDCKAEQDLGMEVEMAEDVMLIQPTFNGQGTWYGTPVPLHGEEGQLPLHERSWLMWLMLIVLPLAPIGLFLLWRYNPMAVWAKFLLTLLFGTVFLIGVLGFLTPYIG